MPIRVRPTEVSHPRLCCLRLRLINTAAEGSFLDKFFDATKDLGAAERGTYLEHPPSGGVDIEEAHQVRERV